MPKVLIVAPVRNREKHLPRYLKAIYFLDFEKKDIGFYFIVNDSIDRSEEIIKDFFQKYGQEYRLTRADTVNLSAPLDARGSIRRQKIYPNLVFLRNKLIDYFLSTDFDYYFSIDSDCLVFPNCLKELLQEDKDIISATISNNFNDSKNFIPNALIRKEDGQYKRIDHTLAFSKAIPCHLTGAVCLIKRKVLEAGVKYGYSPMGEDEVFCREALRKGFQIFTKGGLAWHDMQPLSALEGPCLPEI